MVLKSSNQEIREIREKSKSEDARLQIQNLIRQKIWGVLTDEQKRKFNEMAQASSTEERRPGRVYVLSQEGKAIATPVVLGFTDGTFSELISGDLPEGGEVIVEELTKKKNQGQAAVRPRACEDSADKRWSLSFKSKTSSRFITSGRSRFLLSRGSLSPSSRVNLWPSWALRVPANRPS